jgi:alpha(1,3/1,4) fucosyltransferase
VGVGLYLDPPARSSLQDRWFEQTTGRFHSSLARCLAFVKETLEAQGIPVHTADRIPAPNGIDRHLYVSVCNHDNYEALARRSDVVLSAFLVTEAPVVEPRIYRGLVAAQRRFKRIYSCIDQDEAAEFAGAPLRCRPLRWPIDFRGVDAALWSRTDRRFLVMVNMNKLPRLTCYELFTERMRAVEYFSRTNEVDLYGVGWDRASMRMGRSRLPRSAQRARDALRDWVDRIRPDPLLVAARKVYRGELETKWETLANYDFVLCFENTWRKGWLTEKLFEALRVGTIPVYWGAADIERLVPPGCFVDMRQFRDYAKLRAFLKSLDRSAVQRYREAGRAFLESDAFEPFSREAFAGLFRTLLEEDAGVRVAV